MAMSSMVAREPQAAGIAAGPGVRALKAVLLAGLFALAAACTTTQAKTTTLGTVAKLPAGATVLVFSPDVELSLLTASGLPEPKAEWSTAGRDNIASSVKSILDKKALKFKELDPATSMEGRAGQLVRLNQAVGQSILVYQYGYASLPTKGKKFDWTLGEGAQVLTEQHGADYALFTVARGAYASSGRVAAAIVGAALGVGVPMGSQQMYCSLVDLKTGNVVWFNVATAGPGDDMRETDGAQRLFNTVLKSAPL
jgi:hypothetical protein